MTQRDHHIQGATVVPPCLNSLPAPLHLLTRVTTSPPYHFFTISPQVLPQSSPSVATISHIDWHRPLQPAFTNHQGSARLSTTTSTFDPSQTGTSGRAAPSSDRITIQIATLSRLLALAPDVAAMQRQRQRHEDNHSGGNDSKDSQHSSGNAKTTTAVATMIQRRSTWQQRRCGDHQDGHSDDDDDAMTITAAKIIKTASAT
ncbi:hypothetical protein EDB86DRAFT_2835421 [Lactarius hatsudake]|nr:hypothetical protein EDB86DRAFT_2835421 [Lactarius hatsudake]